MDKLRDLSDEQYKNICNEIPYQSVIGYFKSNPKQYDRICKIRVRATKLNENMAHNLLVNNRNDDFVFSFVEKTVEKWICEINEAIETYKTQGKTLFQATISALAQSFFAKSPAVFFSLTDMVLSDEELQCISESVSIIRTVVDQFKEDYKKIGMELYETKIKLGVIEKESKKNEKLYNKGKNELENAFKKCVQLEQKVKLLLIERDSLAGDNKSLTNERNNLLQSIVALKKEIQTLKQQLEIVEEQVRKQIKEERESKKIEVVSYPLIPKDIEEFKEYFKYNLESCGIIVDDLSNLFVSHIANTVFCGNPIVCQASYSTMFAKCLSNSLVGSQEIPIVNYYDGIENEFIISSMEHSKRIVVLRNFLGNYDETQLLSITQQFPSKIIIIDYMYDHTLQFLPQDFFEYCLYLDLSVFPQFGRSLMIKEDPSTFDEEEYNKPLERTTIFYKKFAKLTCDLGVSRLAVTCSNIDSEEKACAFLLFSVLPYWQRKNQMDARVYSETIQTYIDHSNYRELINKWYENK